VSAELQAQRHRCALGTDGRIRQGLCGKHASRRRDRLDPMPGDQRKGLLSERQKLCHNICRVWDWSGLLAPGPCHAVAYDMQSEMSIYLRLWAGYRLLSGKHTGILTHFQTKVKKK